MRFRSPGKPCLVKYFKWLLKVIKSEGLAKDTLIFATIGPTGGGGGHGHTRGPLKKHRENPVHIN